MKKRILPLLFAALLCTSSLLSCGGGEAETTADTSADIAPVETEAETDSLEARKLVDDGLTDKDFSGEEFRMIYQERYSEFQYVEEMTGDTLDDAVYNRNMTVEDRFNAKIVHNVGAEEQLAMDIKNSVLSGNDEYDLYMGHTMYTGKHSMQGIFRNMYELGIDFSKPWYPQYAVENLTINGRMFLTCSDICLSLASNTYCYYFNKDLVVNNNMEDPYTVVNEGRWTIDYLLENVASIYQDTNGDGTVGNGDLYGFSGEKSNSTVAYLYSFDLDIMAMSETGEISVPFGSDERSVDGIDKLKTLLYGSQGSYNVTADAKGNADMFVEQTAIFTTGVLGDSVNRYRDDCDFDYGIVPYPKFDEAQDTYYTVAGGSISSSAVPLTVTRDEFVGTMFAALSAETWKTVIPQYYDVVLKYKGARDEASIAMIDTILNGRCLGFDFIYDAFSGFVYKTANILKGNTALPTFVAQQEKAVMKHYEAVRDLFFPDYAG
ncbi:MAG: hypothetical protein IKY52_00645 [Clostridia bacterium]|nr:hypothetical protein [Clostridia bacterium]